MRYFVIFSLLLASCFYIGCKPDPISDTLDRHNNKVLHLTGYEHSRPSIVHLPEALAEISGIIFYPKDSSILCVDDDRGSLYKFPLYKRKVLQDWPFSAEGDFEEIVLQDSIFYALKSNGDITRFYFDKKGTVVADKFASGLSIQSREFESMVYDTTRKLLLLTCKDCKDDLKNNSSVWGVDFARKVMLPTPVFVIQHTQIEALLGKKISKFKPSSMAIHPLTGDFYFVSAINNLIVVTDRDGVVKELTVTSKKYFKQPEGLAFLPNGDLLISNEFADRGRATLLLYPYKK